jgi:hypothetical protein
MGVGMSMAQLNETKLTSSTLSVDVEITLEELREAMQQYKPVPADSTESQPLRAV